jgi:sulfite exporter TauE/SafE
MFLLTAFLLGLAGSLHCAGMCGPLVLALAKAGPAKHHGPADPIVYHAGRLASYSLLGLMVGWLGHAFVTAGFQAWLSILLGVTLLAGWVVSARLPLATPVWRWIAVLKRAMQSSLRRNALSSQAVMGALNGLLPCGLVYIAAVGAIATGHPASGMAYMACFGLGTWPLMLGVHIAGRRFPLPARLPLHRVTSAAILLMAVLLIFRGLGLGIPFVSPDPPAATAGADACH